MSAAATGSLLADPAVPVRAVVEYSMPLAGGTITAQPSKNYTTRWLLTGALAANRTTVRRIAASEDSHALQSALGRLGARVETSPGSPGDFPDAIVHGLGGKPTLTGTGPVDVGNAGAVLRLLLAIGALLPEVTFHTPYPDSLGKRPNADLLNALRQLGCDSDSRPGGCLPITLRGGNLHGGSITVSGARSSQYLSALLFLAPLVGEPVTITVTDGLVSKPPVRQTIEVLRASGISIEASENLEHFTVQPGSFAPGEAAVNGDWPGSAAILAAGAVGECAVTIAGLRDDQQGEKESLHVLVVMGCDGHLDARGAHLRGGPLNATSFDGDRATDAVLALLAPACFAAGLSRFHNVANLRLKECDRISEPIRELRKIGVRCWEGAETGDPDPDAIIIEGNPAGYEGGIEVDGRGDHRVIMLETIVGLRCRQGLIISGAQHVAKSYPGFFRDLAALGARVRLEPEA